MQDYSKEEFEDLKRQLEEFQREKDRIRKMIGGIGGQKYSHRDNIVNALFLLIIISLFIVEITTNFLPSMISLELSVLLVSIKIVWMMHAQHRYNHFVFWILHSIEFRVNDLSKTVRHAAETHAP